MAPLPRPDLHSVLGRLARLVEDLRGARIFLTGGTGFFGRWLLEPLLHADDEASLGLEIVVLARDPSGFAAREPHLASHRAVRWQAGDVRTFAFPEGRFEHVIHLATVPTPPAGPWDVLDVILGGTRRVLELAAERGARRFLFASSGAVYGRQPVDLQRVPEDFRGGPDPIEPSSANAEGKRAAELMAVLAGERAGFTTTIARGFAFIGPLLPLDGQFAAGNFVRDALAGGPIVVKGDGTPIRSYLYAADLAEWLLTIHLCGAHGRAYNVGSEDELSIGELARAVAAAFEPATEVVVKGAPTADKLPERYVPSVARARDELGLIPVTPFTDALGRMLAWQKGGA